MHFMLPYTVLTLIVEKRQYHNFIMNSANNFILYVLGYIFLRQAEIHVYSILWLQLIFM